MAHLLYGIFVCTINICPYVGLDIVRNFWPERRRTQCFLHLEDVKDPHSHTIMWRCNVPYCALTVPMYDAPLPKIPSFLLTGTPRHTLLFQTVPQQCSDNVVEKLGSHVWISCNRLGRSSALDLSVDESIHVNVFARKHLPIGPPYQTDWRYPQDGRLS